MIFRPPSPCQLPVPLIEQRNAGECLAACAAMVCTYLKIAVDYDQLMKALDIETGVGAPFFRIRDLERLGISVVYEEYGTLQELYDLLINGWPSIASVETSELSYWNKVSTRHVVVVIGMDDQYIYLNDPAFPRNTMQTSLGDFDLAWLAQDEKYAVLMP